jgi:hypothetical protein
VSESLPCPRCGGASDLASWLDRAERRLAPASSIRASCPRCGGEAHLSLEAGAAAIGTLSPAPALFRPERRAAVPALRVLARFDHTRVELGPRSWAFET